MSQHGYWPGVCLKLTMLIYELRVGLKNVGLLMAGLISVDCNFNYVHFSSSLLHTSLNALSLLFKCPYSKGISSLDHTDIYNILFVCLATAKHCAKVSKVGLIKGRLHVWFGLIVWG